MIASIVLPFCLSTLLAVAPEPAAPAADPNAAAQPADGVPAADVPTGPGWDQLSPEIRNKLAAMDDASLEALGKKADSGAELNPEEQALVEGIQTIMAAQFDAEMKYQTGDIGVRDGLATLHLGENFRYLSPSDAKRVLEEAWGNPPGDMTLGMIVPTGVSPASPEGWGVLITYEEEGHVEDDDADDIDYDELLEQMQEGTEANNAEREKMGYPPLHLVGWAEPPHYDKERHLLYWAQHLRSGGGDSLNYAIRALGRKGVLELNAVAPMEHLAQVKPEMERIYGAVEFEEGNRYSDFDPDIDDVAAYGIGGLIAGKLAMKAGLFAGLLKILVAGKKLLIVLVIGAFAGIKGLLGMKKDKGEEGVADDADSQG